MGRKLEPNLRGYEQELYQAGTARRAGQNLYFESERIWAELRRVNLALQ